MSNSLDPDQARHFVRPDLGPNCLQRLSADNELLLQMYTNILTNNANSINKFFLICVLFFIILFTII